MDIEHMDVDIDFDFEDSNPIKEFLLTKLKEVRLQNNKLVNQISKKKELIADYLRDSTSKTGSLIIEKTWRRIYNDFFIVGYKITNTEHVSLKVSNVLLNWDSSSLITYKLRTFQVDEGNFQRSQRIDKNGMVVLVIEKPNFLKQTRYTLNGIFVYKIAGLEFQVNIPEFKIDVNDYSDMLLEVKNSEVLKGNLEELLVLYSSCEHYQLSGEITSFISREICSVLGNDCMFREIALKSKKIFFIDGLSTNLNNSLMEVLHSNENKFQFSVICKNEDVMLQILHYLYKNITGIQIFPKINEENGDSLSKALLREISIMEEHYKNGKEDMNGKHEVKFRNKLNEFQYETDKLYCSNNV